MQKIRHSLYLGEQLKNLRLDAGFGVTELSKYLQLLGCDITRESIVKIEAGKRHLSTKELRCLKEALNTNYDDIFNFEEA